jgi:ADP-ribose pyrophosphatase YjhB (NUDIX family)
LILSFKTLRRNKVMLKYLDHKAELSTICTSLFLTKGNKVLYGMRNYKPSEFKGVSVWTTPGGRCEVGESIEANLRREALEETGITDITFVRFLRKVAGAKAGDMVYVYHGTTEQEPELKEPEKFSLWRWWGSLAVPRPFINPPMLKIFHKSIREDRKVERNEERKAA